MAVEDEEFHASVVVVVEELRAEAAHGDAHAAQAERIGLFGERAVARVSKERVGLPRKVGDEDVEQAVAVHIVGVHAHAAARVAFGVERGVRLERDLRECAVAVVAEEEVRVVVVRLVDVHPAVVVVVEGDYAETFAGLLADARTLAHVRESAVADIVVERGRRASELRDVAVGPPLEELEGHAAFGVEL